MYGKLPKYSRFIFDTPLILNTAMCWYMPVAVDVYHNYNKVWWNMKLFYFQGEKLC